MDNYAFIHVTNSLTASGPVQPCKSLDRPNGFSSSSSQGTHSLYLWLKQDIQ